MSILLKLNTTTHRFSIEILIPFLGLRMTSGNKGISAGLTLDLKVYFLKIDDTSIFSSIRANLG